MASTDDKLSGGLDFWTEQAKYFTKFLEVSGLEDEIITKNPEKVIIDFASLTQYYTGELAQLLLDQLDEIERYENFISIMQDVIKDFHPNPDKLKLVAIKNMKMRLGVTSIGDFSRATFKKMVCVRAVLRNITEKNPKTSAILYSCNACGNNSSYKVETDFYSAQDKYRHKCRSCMSRQITEVEKVKDIIIRMKLEDPSESSETSHRVSSCYAQVKNLLADYLGKSNISVGDRVIVTGHLVENPTTKGQSLASFFMEIDMIERDTQKEYDENISKEEIEDFHKASQDNGAFLEKIRRSIAPNINGYDDCKLALAIQELSGINLKTRVWDNPQVKKQYVHIILSGDPATSKTQLAKFMMKVSPKIYFASGDQATITGLIGATYQDPTMGGDWTLSAGALVLANGGTIAIDELNKLDAKEISKLNQVLTDYSIPIDKAKINTTIYTEVRLLGIMNPTNDQWKKDDINRQKILQLNFKKAFTTRMTLIFPFFEEDLSSDQDVELALRRQQGLTDDGIKDIFSTEWLKKFFIYAKRKEVIFDPNELIEHKMNFYKNIYLTRIKEYITDVNEGTEYTKDEIPSKMRLLADSYEALLSGFARTCISSSDVVKPLKHHYALVDYLLERYYLSMFFKKEQVYWERAGIMMSVKKATSKVIVETFLRYLSTEGHNQDGVAYDNALEQYRKISGLEDENEFIKLVDNLKKVGEVYEPRAGFLKMMSVPTQTQNTIQEERV